MLNLCDDMIDEIVNYCDPTTIASFYSVNSYLSKKSKTNKYMISRRILANELKKAVYNDKSHYTSKILNLKIGDRVTDYVNNYKVYYVEKKLILLYIVDMYGNVLDDTLHKAYIYNIRVKSKEYNKHDSKNNLCWVTTIHDQKQDWFYNVRLSYGIIKHTLGPYITNVDSKYFKYITKEHDFINPHNIYEPEINMLVTIDYKWNIYEYVIIYIKDKQHLKLESTDKCDINDKYIYAKYIDNKWIIKNKKYNIVLFGGYKKIHY
jgi:hypothetical protein